MFLPILIISHFSFPQNGTLRRYGGVYSTQSDGSSDGGYCGTPPRAASLDALDSLAELNLADSPMEPDSQSRESLLTPKSLMERARMNVGYVFFIIGYESIVLIYWEYTASKTRNKYALKPIMHWLLFACFCYII